MDQSLVGYVMRTARRLVARCPGPTPAEWICR
jgi:hypothetical protein